MQARALKFLSTAVAKLNTCAQHSFTKFSVGSSAQEVLYELSETFEAADISEPSVSAQLLVGEVLGITNLDILPQVIEHSHLTVGQSEKLSGMVQCRLAQMPVQYILGYWDFRQIRLKMRPPIFIPRSETEQLVDLVLDHLKCLDDIETIQILEIGCGTGAISLSLMQEYRTKCNAINILAVDQSRSACTLTIENAMELQLLSPDKGSAEKASNKDENINRLEVLNLKLTEESDKTYGLGNNIKPNQMDVIVSNPPYVLRKDLSQLNPQITLYEDLRALDGGKDGLQVIEDIIMLSCLALKPNSYLFLEIDPCHTYLLPQLLNEISSRVPSAECNMILKTVSKDFQEKDRFAILQKCIL